MAATAGLAMVLSMAAAGTAEARMGGSFGSRGMRTFQSAPVTRTAPNVTAPIQRSMTPYAAPSPTQNAAGFGQPRAGLWSGLGGGLVGGLLGGLFFSGLFGSMMGYGFGGFGGGIAFLFQLLLAFWVGSWILRRVRSRPAGYGASGASYRASHEGASYGMNGTAGTASMGSGTAPRAGNRDEIGITDADLETFEKRLVDVQDAFAREDHAGLRRYTTPEMVSFLSEELADNATNGLRNDVRDLEFLQGDIAESWREGSRDYCTVAMRWSAIDVMRDRKTDAVVKGDPDTPVEGTELWTFVRENGGDWLLSAIQDARG